MFNQCSQPENCVVSRESHNNQRRQIVYSVVKFFFLKSSYVEVTDWRGLSRPLDAVEMLVSSLDR